MGESGRVLIYDGACGFCQRQAARLARWSGGEWHLLPGTSPAADAWLGDLPATVRASQLWVISNGQRSGGADGIVQALGCRSGLRWLTWLYRLPGVRPAARAVYRWIAAHRPHGEGQCALR